MQEFLAVAFSYPTAVYSLLLAASVLYWVLVIAGAFDLDMEGADGLAGAKGGLDGLAGAKGGLDGLGAAGDAIDGALDGADGAKGTALDVGGGGPLTVLYGFLKLRNAPVTVVGSFFSLFAWLMCSVAVQRLGHPGWLLGTGLLLGTGALSILLTSFAIRPLAPVFALRRAKTKRDLVGKIAVVSTGRVTPSFGQATLEEGGDSLTLQIRAPESTRLKRGDRVLLLHADSESLTFEVEKLPDADDLLLSDADELAARREAQAVVEAEAELADQAAKKRLVDP